MTSMYSHTCRADSAPVRTGRSGMGRWGRWLALALLLTGCDLQVEQPGLDEIRQRGVLLVLTRNAPTTYFEKQDQQMGFEYDMAVSFANHLNVAPQFMIYNAPQDLLDALLKGQGDLVAAGMTITPELQKRFRFGPGYMEVDQEVVCRRGGKRPRSMERLHRVKLLVGRGSSQEARLRQLRQEIPNLRWTSATDISTEETLDMVWRKEVDCTVTDSNVMAFNRRYYPELVTQFSLENKQTMAWIIPKRAIALQRELGRWFRRFQERGEFDRIYERYYAHLDLGVSFDFMENRIFLERIEERLPLYKTFFELAEKKYGISWRMLAALAYQESHWDVTVTSPTGVKGIMMLTTNTAKHIGVRNRLDPRESILGGAWYLAELMRQLPGDIQEPDRTWIALAAYNVGMGHILDARELARDFGYNPSEWASLRKVLPMLSHRKIYETLKHGYARGSEPVQFVRNVRHYMDILDSMDTMVPARSLRLRSLAGEGIQEEMDSDELYDPSVRYDDDGLGELHQDGAPEVGTLTLGRMFEDVLEDLDLDDSGNVESAVQYLMDLLHMERSSDEKKGEKRERGPAVEASVRPTTPVPEVPPMPATWTTGEEEAVSRVLQEKPAPLPEVPPLSVQPGVLALSVAGGASAGGGVTLAGMPLQSGSTTTVSWTVYAGLTPGSGVVVVVAPAAPGGQGATPTGGGGVQGVEKPVVPADGEEGRPLPLPEPPLLKIRPAVGGEVPVGAPMGMMPSNE